MEVAQGQGKPWWRWSPFGLLLVAPVAASITQGLAPMPHGHWSSHLANTAISASHLAVLIVVAVPLAVRQRLGGRRSTLLALAILAVVAVGLVMQVVGNQRIAASIWQTDYGDHAAGLVGPGYPGFASGHALAARGDMLVWLGGLAFTVTLGLLRRVPAGVAVVGVVFSLLPPWILPGLGVVFVLAWLLARGSRRMAAADGRSLSSAGGHSTQARRGFREHDQRKTGTWADPEPAREMWPPS
jgi:hypothetical protein